MTEGFGIYVDPDTGKTISTHSMLKTFRRCPKQADYKYVHRLKPRYLGRPLRLGSWMHKLEEVFYNGGDWREEHRYQSHKFNELFDEERDVIGDLPRDCERLMESYLWHYRHEDWKVLETEFTLEAELPDGSIFRGRVDNLIEDQFGLWIVDHKWHGRLPTHEYRILDAQSVGYMWAALRSGIPVQGHIWNYGRSKVPTVPELTKTGLISRWARMDTDYPTAAKWIRDHKEELRGGTARYLPKLEILKKQQYQPGMPNMSPFFRRVVVEKSKRMVEQGMRELYHTHKRMHNYPWEKKNAIERVPDRSCLFTCSYIDICSAELVTGAVPVDIRRRYSVGDPMDYYRDDREGEDKGLG